jgi:hypothetical protein
MMTGEWLELVVLGAVLIFCVVYIIRKVRAKFSSSGGSCCDDCNSCGEEATSCTLKNTDEMKQK